jgi:hypothetical protein
MASMKRHPSILIKPIVPRETSRKSTTIEIFKCLTGSMMDADYLLRP